MSNRWLWLCRLVLCFRKEPPRNLYLSLWSLRGDFVMFADILLGDVPLLAISQNNAAKQIEAYRLKEVKAD